MRSVGTLWSVAIACAVLSACKEEGVSGAQLRAAVRDGDKASAESSAPAAPVTADSVFSTRCATCHGFQGRGDGPGAQALKPRPRDYTNVTWQKSVTDAQIKKTIIEGGAAVGKSSLMAPNADLADKPEVLNGLIAIIRGFSGNTAAQIPQPTP